MTPHERECFNDALHKVQVHEAERSVRDKLAFKLSGLTRMSANEQLSYLYKLEEALR